MAEGGDAGSSIQDSVYTSSGCLQEQLNINIVPINYAIANAYIKLLDKIKNAKSCTNIKNKDERYFLFCHLLHERYRLCNNEKITDAE